MFDFILSDDPKQSLRMFRHLAALVAALIFTAVSVYFYYNDLFSISRPALSIIVALYWCGLFCFTLIIRSGLNQRFSDPSLTVPQILWNTLFLLIITYLLNEWRGLMLMAYFGILSFGYFRLKFNEFLSVALFATLGYAFIIGFLFSNEPERIDIKLEFLQWMIFSITITVMLYTGSAVQNLRERAKQQYIELQEVLEQNRKLAVTDALTGLFNRRHFMEMLTQQKALSERDGADFVICYCDLDHFKQINDNFGHHAGDAVLQQFARIIKSSVREIDFVSRFGGEEFVIMLVNIDMGRALKVTERIRRTLANYNFSDIAPSLHVTVSIGMANFKHYHTIQETLMSADNRMYRAKELGRNRVIASEEGSAAA